MSAPSPFAFLAAHDPLLATVTSGAWRNALADPSASLVKQRTLTKPLAEGAAADYAGPLPVVQRAERKKVQAKQAREAKRRQREAEKARAAQAERERGEARDRALDEAFHALPEADRDALTARAVARLKDEAPQVHVWYQAELVSGADEDAMRPAVLSTLRAFRRDLLADTGGGT